MKTRQSKSHIVSKAIMMFLGLAFVQNVAAQSLSLEQISKTVSNVEKAFVTMPDDFYLNLTQEMRVLMVDRMRKGEEPKVKNKFGGESRIDSIDQQNSWIRIKNSENGVVEIKVLEREGRPAAIFLIFTACAPACSSHTGVFTLDWRLMPAPLFSTISLTDFLDFDKIKADGKNTDYVTSLVDLQLVEFSFADDHKTLKAKLNSEKELSQEDIEKVKPYIKTRQITFVWDGNSFIRQ